MTWGGGRDGWYGGRITAMGATIKSSRTHRGEAFCSSRDQQLFLVMCVLTDYLSDKGAACQQERVCHQSMCIPVTKPHSQTPGRIQK